ncbi:MAG: TetR/AcrR family transcriptional regulator [Caulobacter sp.]|jgi:AcrR family transcriptional regulator|nr:TetR/AcrR family transcriptional regulator [Caulobacter sp.]
MVDAPPLASPARRKPRVDRDARRAEYVSVAARVLLEKGLHTATMRDIAEAAGAAKVLFYRLFPSREALVEAVFQRVEDEFREAYAKPWEGYGSLVRHVLIAARREPEPFLLVFKNVRSAGLDWEERLRVILAQVSLPLFKPAEGAPPGADIRALRASAGMFGLFVDSMITWLEDSDGLSDEERIRWWGHIVKAWREAAREAFRLD